MKREKRFIKSFFSPRYVVSFATYFCVLFHSVEALQTVNSSADSGPGTLRNALANINPGGTSSLTKTGIGTLLLNGNNAGFSSGTLGISGGVLTIGTANSLGTPTTIAFNSATLETSVGGISSNSTITLGTGATVQVDTGTTTFSGHISGTSSLSKTGTGTLILSGNNSGFTAGSLTISSGLLNIASVGGIGNPTTIVFNGTTLEASVAGVSSTAGIILGTGATIQVDTGTTSISGPVTGTSSLTKTGPGTLVLGENNSGFTSGTFNISNGILNIGNASGLGGATSIIFNGTTLEASVGGVSSNAAITLGAGATVQVDTGTTTFSGPISGNTSLTKTGPGALSFIGNNAGFTAGTLSIAGGTLNIASTNSLGTPTTIAFNSSTLDISVGGVSTNSAITLGTGATVQVDTGTTTFSGPISGTSSLVKAGAGTLLLNGNNVGFSSGTLAINGGTLNIAAVNSLGTPTTIAFNGGILETSIGGVSTNAAITLGSGATIQVDVGTTTLSGAVSGTSSLIKTGPGTLVLNGNNSGFSSGTLGISAGTLNIAAANSLGTPTTIAFNGGLLETSVTGISSNAAITLGAGATVQVDTGTTTFLGPISGNTSLVKTGTGTLILGGNNTGFTSGVLNISNGTLNVANASGLGGVTNIIFNGTTLETSVGGISSAAAITLGAGATLQLDTGTTTLSGPISGSTSLTTNGAGTLVLSGNNTNFTGPSTINNLELKITNPNGLINTSAIAFNGTILETSVDGVLINAPINFGVPAATFKVDTGTTTMTGGLNGITALSKTGAGTLALTGTSSYFGPTIIKNGTLNVNGTLFSSIIVNFGALFSGNASVGSVINNGTVSPGNSIGTIFINGDYTQTAVGALDIEIDQFGASDLLNITGQAFLDGILNVYPLPGSYFLGINVYTIINAAGGVSGQFPIVNILDPQLQLQLGVNYLPNQVQLVVNSNQLFLGKIINAFNPSHVEQYIERISFLDSQGVFIPSELDLFDVILALSGLDQRELINALNQLQPAQFGAFEIVNSNVRSQIASILNRHPGELCCHRLDVCCSPCGNASIYVEPFGMFMDQRRVDDQIGFDSTAGGLLLGVNYAFQNNILLGAAVGGTDAYLKWDEHAGNARIKSGFLSLYADWMSNIWYLESSLIAGKDFFKASRNIQFTGVDRTAENKHKGFDILAHLGAGADFSWKKVCLHPFFLTDYSYLHQGRYEEHGAQSLDLIVHERDDQMIRVEEGLYLTRSFKTERGCFAPSIWLSWISEIPISRQLYTTSFVGQDVGTFTARSFGKISNRLSPGLDITWRATDCISLAFRYSAEIGRYFSAQKGDLRFEWSF